MSKAAITQPLNDLEIRASNCVALCFSRKQAEFGCIRRYHRPLRIDVSDRGNHAWGQHPSTQARAKLPAKRSQAQQWRISPWTLLLAFNAVDYQ
jgi:hypothetical protein